jgi:phosphoribulokinase
LAKKPISPSNNLIVCGLHSLFNQSENNLYDLKIYMDTDDLLKKKWKISRDVKERGYTPDQVLSNIKNRESDIEQFILPQKDNADVIIKFFTIDDIDLQNLNVNPKLSLELLIDKSFNIKHILKKLSDNKIEFDLQDENRFNKVTFLNYKRLIFFDINKNYTFYDYILYFILNLNYNG